MIDLSQRTTIGKTTLSVPRLAFGTAPLSVAPAWGSGPPIDESQAHTALLAAFAQGVTWFDTAPSYGRGLAELRTGKALSSLPRDQIVIATKVGFVIEGSTIRRDYSREGVLRSLEASLKRLNAEAIDLLYVHDPDDHARQVLDETFPALADLRAQGVIKAIGAGMNQWQVPMQFAQHADFDCFMIAGRWTLLEQGALPLLDVCHKKNIAIFAASIYNSGILAVGSASPQARYNHALPPLNVISRVQAIEDVCKLFDLSLHAAATQYPFAHPAVKALVVGFQSDTEVNACLNAIQKPIPMALWERLRADGLLVSEAPLPSKVVLL
jgi:D-threo-aldose 1-dehydrogenase